MEHDGYSHDKLHNYDGPQNHANMASVKDEYFFGLRCGGRVLQSAAQNNVILPASVLQAGGIKTGASKPGFHLNLVKD